MVKILGGSMSMFAGYAWVVYLFAGTGFALPICIAIATGGIILAAYSTAIANWLNSNYHCPVCNSNNWDVII